VLHEAGASGYTGGMMAQIPNILTFIRILAAPVIVAVYFLLPRPLADEVAVALLILASVTDWVDGYLARLMGVESPLGAMLDPIADKVLVGTVLLLLAALFGLNPLVLIPAAAIMLREFVVSGMREHLGKSGVTMKVTWPAKVKTTVQMVGIILLLGTGIAEHALFERTAGMDPGLVRAIFAGDEPDLVGLTTARTAWNVGWYGGLILLWTAAALTLWTGWAYFQTARKAMKARP